MTKSFVCAVDVGTGSARAGILDTGGTLLGRAEHPIVMNRPKADHAEHDSQDIWSAVCIAVRVAREKAGVAAEDILGISFDATCSLVVRGRDGGQLSVSVSGDRRWDTIVWLDHRAIAEADECTESRHAVLDYIGGVMSPEMETPKLMWLKRNLPGTWNEAGYLFDLADFLSWKATGSLARSQCTLTAKWTYLAHEETGWRHDFFEAVGLGDLFEHGNLPDKASPVGADLGRLSAEAAAELGLTEKCRVGAGVIDAYAGALGVLGGFAGDETDIGRHLALIAGTSSCVMAMSPDPQPFAGVWGPYYG
ncbi:MAG: ribulokinase, partial [Mesorhizobium sp.]